MVLAFLSGMEWKGIPTFFFCFILETTKLRMEGYGYGGGGDVVVVIIAVVWFRFRL